MDIWGAMKTVFSPDLKINYRGARDCAPYQPYAVGLVGRAVPCPPCQRRNKVKMSKKAIKITPEQKRELKALCVACKAADEAKRLRGRLKTFMEDNEELLRQGLVFEGMKILVRVSKQLLVTDPED